MTQPESAARTEAAGALRRPHRRGSLTVALVFLAAGCLLSGHIKAVGAKTAAPEQPDAAAVAALEEQYRQERERGDRLQEQLAALEAEEDRLALAAGLSDVSGSGVCVIMDDSKAVNTTGDEADYLIHDSDLLSVVNELRAAGAEALSLNGERLLSTSEIRCAGPVVIVNGRQKAAPFTIFAIGDPTTLSDALTMRNGVVELLGAWGISVKVTIHDQLTIPGYDGALEYHYAQAIQEGPGDGEVG